MSVQTQIDRISGNVSAALSAIADKGVTVPDGSNSDALAGLIQAIQAGGGSDSTKIAYGTSLSGYSNPNVTVTHGLGVVPNFAICYRQLESTVTARQNSIIFVAKVNNDGILCCYSSGVSGGKDSNYSITDTPSDYAPFVGAYGATESKITFGVNYDSSRGDTYYCFEQGWDYYNWIVGVI